MDEYGQDVLSGDDRHRREVPDVVLRPGLLIEVLGDGFVGAAVGVSSAGVVLEDRRGRRRTFGLDGGFMVDDQLVRLVPPPRRSATVEPRVTASGSLAVEGRTARVARQSRILVEGVHDAELVEHVWGHDLRVEGVVVEPLHGVDDLAGVVRAFVPTQERRLGVLVDHLVTGSKESRVAATVDHPHVLVTGHPFVDVWAAVKPERLGLEAWPDVPRDRVWKDGICEALGETEHRPAWNRILGSVRTYTDLDRRFVGAVEQLIDFVTETG